MDKFNATFHSFKSSGKWYASERGVLPEDVFGVFSIDERRDAILKGNDGLYPGLNGAGREFMFVVIPDEDCPFGYPLMLKPTAE